MRSALLMIGLALALCGCSNSTQDEDVSSDAPDRDGFQGQMGVMAGDPSDYGN